MSKIALAFITKNSEGEAPRMVRSVMGALDGLFCIDTGSTDNTPAILRDLGVTVVESKDQHWMTATKEDVSFAKQFIGEVTLKEGDKILDFASARNHSISIVPKEYDWILWLDSDDIFRGVDKVREAVQIAEQQKKSCVFFNYLYHTEMTPDGHIKNILIQHLRERLFKNNDTYKWVGAIHETLVNQAEPSNLDLTGMCDVVHITNGEKIGASIQRNIRSLELEVSKLKGLDPRPTYYLAKAYVDMRQPKFDILAEQLFLKYLFGVDAEGTAKSGWAEERAQCWEYLGSLYLRVGKPQKAIDAYFEACKEDPKFPMNYLSLANAYVAIKDFDKAMFWVQKGIETPVPQTTLINNPKDHQAKALETIYWCSLGTSKIDEAFDAMNQLSKLDPNNTEIKGHLSFISELKAQKELSKHIYALANFYKATGNESHIGLLLQGLPLGMQEIPTIVELKNMYLPPKVWGDDEVVIFCGPGFSAWSPRIWKEQGVGGSEEAVIHLSKDLTQQGYKVTVFADPGADAGVVDGVNYKNFFECNFKDQFNIFVAWRQVGLFDMDIKAKKKFLDLHDVPNSSEFTPPRLSRIDKILVKSQFHRELLPNVPGDKIAIITNGLTIPEFKPRKRVPHKVFYGSSYDRGLQHLLKIWPKVLEAVPDATLEICYGWDLFTKFYSDNPERMAWKARIDKLMTQPGITHHGRVGHPELEEIMSECSVWAYPTHFDEISCCVGDTPILMPRDHQKHPYGVPIKELVGKSNFPVFSYDHESDRIVLGNVLWVKKTRENAELLKITLDDGSVLRFTPDHRFMMRDGTYKEAQQLEAGDSLMPCYERPTFSVKQPNGYWETEHRMVGQYKSGDIRDLVVDHIDGNRHNNTPENLAVLNASDHATKTFKTQRTFTALSKKRMSDSQKELAKTPERQEFLSGLGTLRANKLWEMVRSWDEVKQKEWLKARRAKNVTAGAVVASPEEKSVWGKMGAEKRWHNHKVVSVELDPTREDVYDMEVENYHNFAAGGVFVHNCITAMRAQALGLKPVVINKAALKETVLSSTYKTEGDVYDPTTLIEYTQSLCRALQDPNTPEEINEWGWDKIASQWAEQFKAKPLYTKEWLKQTWNNLPQELKQDEFKSYRLS